jgi:hypothetical protein
MSVDCLGTTIQLHDILIIIIVIGIVPMKHFVAENKFAAHSLPRQLRSVVCTSPKLEKLRSTDAELAGQERRLKLVANSTLAYGRNTMWHKPVFARMV